MELDELVTKLINHIDETAVRTKNEMVELMGQQKADIINQMEQQKSDIIREVNVLMKDQQKQFNTFGEGLDILQNQVSEIQTDVANIKGELSDFRIESRLKFKELADDQKEIKTKLNELDQEFEIKLRRVK